MKKLLFILIGLGIQLGAHAEIYKQVDADGHVTYSNVPIKGATKLNLDPPPSGSSSTKAPARTATPANFPRVDQETQRQRDDKRRQILEDELANEKKALEEARKNYVEGEANPEMFTAAGGKRFRNVPKYEEKMKGLQEDVSQHEKNVELLEKELGSLK
ncbi:MAG TPA: DUF4124 domain-containing protein [Methylophilaceae bacterium]|nr:DUF4124 domain-containing protein [Methylophilaceae bacterium]HQR61172.1 DUF4124 domain-containing protein [Methylophilaceae bacterium]